MKEYICVAVRHQLSTFMPVEELIRCKDCKYFELNYQYVLDELTMFTLHEICTKWGDGCKTSENGFCFMAERKEE